MKIMNNQCFSKNLALFQILVLLISFFVTKVHAKDRVKSFAERQNEELIIEYTKPISIELSSNFINRFNFKNNRISKIVGDHSKFTSVLSSDGSNLFLTSKIPSENEFDISVIDVHAEVFDLHFILKKTTKPTLLTLIKPKLIETDACLSKTEVGEMIKAMKQGYQGKYYVSLLNRDVAITLPEDLKIEQYAQYRYGKLYGACFEVKNTSRKKTITFSEDEIASSFEHLIAVSAEKMVLSPLQSSRVFVIFEGEVL